MSKLVMFRGRRPGAQYRFVFDRCTRLSNRNRYSFSYFKLDAKSFNLTLLKRFLSFFVSSFQSDQ